MKTVLGKLIRQGDDDMISIYEKGNYIISRDIEIKMQEKDQLIEGSSPAQYTKVQEVV